MTIEIKFDDTHQHIFWQIFPEKWSWEEYLDVSTKAAEVIRKNQIKTHLILDARNTNFPKSGTAFQYGRKGAKLYPDNTGEVVIITKSMLINSVLEIIQKITRDNFLAKIQVAETVAEAYQIIERNNQDAATS